MAEIDSPGEQGPPQLDAAQVAEQLDRQWIAAQVEKLFGQRDPRVSRWRELCEASPI